MGHINALKLLIEVGHADINATNGVSHTTVSYELFPLKYNILMWYSKLIQTCLIPRLSITLNILMTYYTKKCFNNNYKKWLTIGKVLKPNLNDVSSF